MWFQEDWDHFWAGEGVRIWHLISPVSEFRMSDSWPLFYFKTLLALLIGGASGKEPGCQCRRSKRHRFDPWVEKIPWRRARQPTPVLLSGESMDRGAWQAIVLWVEKSQKRRKQLNTAHTAHRRFTWRYLPGNLGQKAAALALLIWVHPPGNE